MRHEIHDGTLTIWLGERIDTNNAPDVETDISALVDELSPARVVLDATSLTYLSSAGLRIVMRLLKRCGEVRMVNVTPEVYDVLSMTGVSEIMSVSRTPREQSLELLLIDMGDASVGSPDIDLAGTFHVLRIAARRPGGAERLTCMSSEAIERRLRTCALPRTMGSTARSKLITDEVRMRQAHELERQFLAACEA